MKFRGMEVKFRGIEVKFRGIEVKFRGAQTGGRVAKKCKYAYYMPPCSLFMSLRVIEKERKIR